MLAESRQQKLRSPWMWGVVIGISVVAFYLSTLTNLGVLALAAGFAALVAIVWSVQLTQRRIVTTLLALSILGPGIPAIGALKVRPEELLLLALLPIVVTRLQMRWHWIDLGFLLVAFSTGVSLLWGMWYLNIPFSPRDLMEFVKLIKFWLLFRVAFRSWSGQDIRYLMRGIIVLTCLAGVIAIIQWTDWGGIGSWTKELYGLGNIHVRKTRVIGTMQSPNYSAMLLLGGLAFVITAYQWKKSSWRTIVPLFLLLIGSALTLSRTGVAATSILFAVVLGLRMVWLWKISPRRWIKTLLIALIIIAILGITVGLWVYNQLQALQRMTPQQRLVYYRQGLIQRILFRFVADNLERGTRTRLSIWQRHFPAIWESPLLGWGPGKSVHATVTDNGYVLFLRRYGVVGTIINLLLYGTVLHTCWRRLRYHPYQSPHWNAALAVLGITLTYLAANLTMEVFYELQLMAFYWLSVGIACSTSSCMAPIPSSSRT